jgi:flagellar hook-basal body complex protein FliE
LREVHPHGRGHNGHNEDEPGVANDGPDERAKGAKESVHDRKEESFGKRLRAAFKQANGTKKRADDRSGEAGTP